MQTQSRNVKQFHSLIIFDYCSVLKITELTLVCRPIYYLHTCCIATSYWFTNSTHMRWPRFHLFRKTPKQLFWIQIYDRFFFLCKNWKDTKHLNNFSCLLHKNHWKYNLINNLQNNVSLIASQTFLINIILWELN